MTTIQKFEDVLNAPAGPRVFLNDADNVIVMVDEAHRTQYGRLAAKMRAAMPQATFVGFTGTPIDKGFRRTTLGVFGDLIDSYTIPQSVEDRTTVPIHYEARLPDLHIEGPQTLDRLFEALFGDEPEATRTEIRRRYANKERIAEAATCRTPRHSPTSTVCVDSPSSGPTHAPSSCGSGPTSTGPPSVRRSSNSSTRASTPASAG